MEKIPNQNKFVGGARICASSACCCIDLLHQIWPKKPSPAHLEFALEETLVKARWEGEVEVGLGKPWPDPGGLHQLPHGAAPLRQLPPTAARRDLGCRTLPLPSGGDQTNRVGQAARSASTRHARRESQMRAPQAATGHSEDAKCPQNSCMRPSL
jgi:hypothetical protein